jgi:hypothetical protein
MELRERGKGKEDDTVWVLYTIRCEGRGYKDVYWKTGVGSKAVRESIQRDWTDQSKAHP